jgi:uncharacterized protein YndB with AHSA1/START domain
MNKPLVIERIFNANVATVWRAISNKEDMKKWYFDLPEFKAEIGFKFDFSGGKDPAHPYRHLCQVTTVIPGKKLAYSWRYEGYDGTSIVTFELFEEGDKTKLKLTHEGLETFPVGNPDLAKENFAEGWNHIINIALKEFLESPRTQ